MHRSKLCGPTSKCLDHLIGGHLHWQRHGKTQHFRGPRVQSLIEASITTCCRVRPCGPWPLRRSDAWREGRMRMVGRLFVMSALMVLSCFAMVTRGVRMVFCRVLVVLGCFLRHGVFPVLGCTLGKALSRQKPSATSAKRSYMTRELSKRARWRVVLSKRPGRVETG